MPWYPRARRHDVGRDRRSADRHNPVRINHHTAVTNAQHLDRQAGDRSQAYPHFMIGRDGQVVQYQDTSYIARADLEGNRAGTISIETWDGYPKGAPGYWKHNGDVPPWTDKQVEAIVALDRWLIERHPSIPTRLARDSKPGTSSHGLSWHRLGCDGNFPNTWPYWGRRSGGMKYSNALGKQCPGDRRIAQVVDVIFPALSHGVAGITIPPVPTVPEGHLDMHPDELNKHLSRHAENVVAALMSRLPGEVDEVVRKRDNAQNTSLHNMVRRELALAIGSGTPVDIDGLAERVAGLLEDDLIDAVTQTVTSLPGATPEQIKAEVRQDIANRLTQEN